MNNDNKSNCGFEAQIVSYIYDEATEPERRKFESHLIACTTCTDEFAEISNARFSVFEWQKEEFSPLLTPQIVIPYADRKPITEGAAAGWFEGMRGIFSGFGIPVTVAAALLIFLGIGFTAITLVRGTSDQIAANVVVEQPEKAQPVLKNETALKETETNRTLADSAMPLTVKTDPSIRSPARPVKAVVESKRPSIPRQLTAETVKNKNIQVRKAPALSNFDEADDRSLRLADLFDEEIGSIR